MNIRRGSGLPEWFPRARQFKRDRRAALKRVLRELEQAQIGCAYAPAFEAFKEAQKQLAIVARAWSEKEWGR